MTFQPKDIHIIVCEGVSEKAYIQELNRFLDEKDYPFIFIPKPINNGHYRPATIKYKQIKKENPHSKIYIWVDKDTYLRNDNNDEDNYKKKSRNIPNFLFSYNNFEDFITLHLEKTRLNKWYKICQSNNHFKVPMHSETYISLYRNTIIPKYKKGEMPFNITEDLITNLLTNLENNQIQFKCDFADLIKHLITTTKSL